MAIAQPRGFSPERVNFQPTLQIDEFDFSQFEELGDDMIELENDRLDRIEENYNSIMDTKDALLGLDPGSVYGQNVINRKRKDFNIEDGIFDLSMDELKDPFLHRQIRSSLVGLVNDQEVKNVLLEGQEIQKFNQFIRKLERTDPEMALVAKRDLNKVRTDPQGKFNIHSIQPSDYQKIDFADLMKDELDKLPKDLKMTVTNDGQGYIIFSESNDFQMTGEEFAEMVADKYADDPRVANTFRSQVDPTKPPSERMINDPDAVENYLRENAQRVFSQYEGLTTKNVVKEDKLLLDRIRTENDIKLKTTVPGKNTNPTQSFRDGQIQTFDTKVFGNYGSTVGTELSKDGYEVDPEELLIVNQAFEEKKSPRRTQNADGSISYTIQNDLGESQEIARFNKLKTSPGFIGTGIEERYLNQNPVLKNASTEDKNLALTVLRNPQVRGADGVSSGPLQDVFFDEVMYPRYVDWKNQIESDTDLAEKAVERGIYGNKLFYLLHHNGLEKTKEYIRTGKAPIKGNPNSDNEITGAFERVEQEYGENWNDIPTSEYIKFAESRGNDQALFTQSEESIKKVGKINSSAFGGYQFTLRNWGQELKDFIADRLPNTDISAPVNRSEGGTAVTDFFGVSGSNTTSTDTADTTSNEVVETPAPPAPTGPTNEEELESIVPEIISGSQEEESIDP